MTGRFDYPAKRDHWKGVDSKRWTDISSRVCMYVLSGEYGDVEFDFSDPLSLKIRVNSCVWDTCGGLARSKYLVDLTASVESWANGYSKKAAYIENGLMLNSGLAKQEFYYYFFEAPGWRL